MSASSAPTARAPKAAALFRIGSLVAPPAIAWTIAVTTTRRALVTRTVTELLAPIAIVVGIALVLRIADGILAQRAKRASSAFHYVDVLTPAGVALAWSSSAMIVLAVWIGWASLAVVGAFGLGLLYLVVLRAFVTAAFRVKTNGTIRRTFTTGTVTEGDDVAETIHVDGVRIPLGYRLFVEGKLGPRWKTSRHVLDASATEAEIVLESEIGPAIRGDDDVPPLHVWLEDTFGLCRSPRVAAAPAKLTVLPRLCALGDAATMLDNGFGARTPKAARRPTEGAGLLREYQPGDDIRRVHWVRSAAAGELVVRIPDEIPPDRPRVRVVLDTFFPGASEFASDAPAEMLDAMVAIWLATGRALAQAGARVTLVTAALPAGTRDGDARAVGRRVELSPRSPGAALALGAQVRWQDALPVDAILGDEATYVVSRGVLVEPPKDPKFRWIVVLPTHISEPSRTAGPSAIVPFPAGHPENGAWHRRTLVRRTANKWRDHSLALRELQTNVALPPAGSFFARMAGTTIRLAAIQ